MDKLPEIAKYIKKESTKKSTITISKEQPKIQTKVQPSKNNKQIDDDSQNESDTKKQSVHDLLAKIKNNKLKQQIEKDDEPTEIKSVIKKGKQQENKKETKPDIKALLAKIKANKEQQEIEQPTNQDDDGDD